MQYSPDILTNNQMLKRKHHKSDDLLFFKEKHKCQLDLTSTD